MADSRVPPSRPLLLLVKPASADCNLACDYCFYTCKGQLYPSTAVHRMSDAVLERMIATYMRTAQPQYAFAWQGGEPTLLGREFFERVTALQLRHAPPGATVTNGLQTNATLIDDPFAAHLAEYRFLLGVSLDGPPKIHDAYRHNRAGHGSHEAVLRGIGALRRHDVALNALTLISQANVRHAREVYHYLTEEGLTFHQYIPCVEHDAGGKLQPFAIGGEEWGRFLCELFEAWYPRDVRRVSVRHFDALLDRLVTGGTGLCSLGRDCCQYLVVEHNGDLYPCDFFVEGPLRIGNLASMSWEQALDAPAYRAFGALKAQWNPTCADCPYLEVCAGDCLKHRLFGPTPDPRRLSSLCAGWKLFFDRALPTFRQLAREIQEARQYPPASSFAAPRGSQSPGKVGRNDPCPCGSGRKHKHCCGR